MWMKTILNRPNLHKDNLSRIKDVVDLNLGSLRNRMRGSEESWVMDPAQAFRNQVNPLFLTVGSFLTQKHALLRLRWQLKQSDKNTLENFIKWMDTTALQAKNGREYLISWIEESPPIPEDIDFVLGYRKRDKSMPIHRRFSNSVTSFIISKLTNKDILDSQCGFRRYNLDLVNSFYYKENGFQFESEILIKCLNDNTSMTQIKIETIYDKNNKSYINHVSDTLKFIKLILKSLIKR